MPSDHAANSTSISAPTTPAPNPPPLASAFSSFAVNLPPSIPPAPAPASIPRPSTLAPPTSITRRHSALPLLAPAPVSFNFLLLFRHLY